MAPIRSFPFVSVRFRSFPLVSVGFRSFPFVSVGFRSFLCIGVLMSLAISFGKWQTMDGGNPQNLGAIQLSFKHGLPERPQKTTPRPPNFDECLKKSIPRVFSPLSFLIHCLMLTNLPKTIRNLSKTVKAQSGIDQKSVRNQSGIYQTMCKIRQGIGNK